jgi:NTE family protein
VALILAGGGARGAYEAGVLSVLLPVLEQRGELPRVVIGTSVGALNAGFIAANAHVPTAEMTARAVEIWETMTWRDVARGVASAASLKRVFEYAGEVLGVPRARIESLLDPEPMRRTVRDRLDFPQIERNVGAGRLDAVGVVTTSGLTGRSVVFHTGLESPPRDDGRGIDYVAAPLTAEHVLASASIPGVFPAVHVDRPEPARGWYYDGGTRLNTPIKPALALGAKRVIVIAPAS